MQVKGKIVVIIALGAATIWGGLFLTRTSGGSDRSLEQEGASEVASGQDHATRAAERQQSSDPGSVSRAFIRRRATVRQEPVSIGPTERRAGESVIAHQNRLKMRALLQQFLDEAQLTPQQRRDWFALVADVQVSYQLVQQEFIDNPEGGESYVERFHRFETQALSLLAEEFGRQVEDLLSDEQFQIFEDVFSDPLTFVELLGPTKPMEVASL